MEEQRDHSLQDMVKDCQQFLKNGAFNAGKIFVGTTKSTRAEISPY